MCDVGANGGRHFRVKFDPVSIPSLRLALRSFIVYLGALLWGGGLRWLFSRFVHDTPCL